MWIAFIIALMLELLKKAETVGTAVKYIIVSFLLTAPLGLIMAYITPIEAIEVVWYIYVFMIVAYAVLGLFIAKVLRRVAGV